jgi:hypothetical protein
VEGGRHDLVQVGPGLLGQALGPGCELREAEDVGEGLVELVRDAGGELADGGQAVCMAELDLQP